MYERRDSRGCKERKFNYNITANLDKSDYMACSRCEIDVSHTLFVDNYGTCRECGPARYKAGWNELFLDGYLRDYLKSDTVFADLIQANKDKLGSIA